MAREGERSERGGERGDRGRGRRDRNEDREQSEKAATTTVNSPKSSTSWSRSTASPRW